MSFELLNQPLMNRIGCVLVHSLWQGAIAAGVLKLLRLSMRRSSANSRYLAACAVLFLTACAPVLTFLYWPETVFGWISNQALGTSPPITRAIEISTDYSGHNSMVNSELGRMESIAPWLAALWSIGATISFLRLAQDYWRVGLLRRRAHAPLDPAWLEILEDLKCRLNVARSVCLLKSSLVEVPMVIGWLSPVILLPASSLVGLTPPQLEAILAHELAHIRRHDYLVNVFQIMVETLMFFHPAVWWMSRCIREERENCCDDLVTRVCEDRLIYARALTRLEEMRATTAQFAFAATGGLLVKRIRRLVGVQGDDRPVSLKEIGGIVLVTIGVILVMTGVALLIIPPAYEAMARIKIEQPSPAQLLTGDGKVSLSLYDPYFIQTEIAVMISDSVLKQVITRLKLDQRWSGTREQKKSDEPKLISLLRTKLTVRPYRSTTLVDIRASSARPDEAAAIANTLAAEYLNNRQSSLTAKGSQNVGALENRLKQFEVEIEKNQQNVIELKEHLQISDAAANENSPVLSLSAATLQQLEGQRIQMKTELVKQESLLSHLRKLTTEELVQALPTALQDTQMNSLAEARNIAEQQLASQKHSFGPESEVIRGLKSQIDDLNTKIQKRIDGIMLSLQARTKALQSSVNVLEAEIQIAHTNDMVRSQQLGPYYEAKAKLEQLKRFAQILSLKLAAEKMEVELPHTFTGEIIDQAIAPIAPVSLARYRGTGCSSAGLFLTIVGMLTIKRSSRSTPVSQA